MPRTQLSSFPASDVSAAQAAQHRVCVFPTSHDHILGWNDMKHPQGTQHDSLMHSHSLLYYVQGTWLTLYFLCFSIRLTRLAWKKMPGWPTSSESGTTFGSSFHSRHDDRKIGTLNSQKESTGRSGRLEIGRDAKFGGCCKLATFTWRCLIDLDWIRWLFMLLPPEGEAPTSSAGTAMSAFWNSLVGGRDERVYITISLCVPFVDCKWLQCGRELDLTCCGYDMRCRLLQWCT